LNINTLSRLHAEHYQCTTPHVVISITDPKESEVTFPQNPYRKDILRLKFYDLDKTKITQNSKIEASLRSQFPDLDTYLFSPTHAQQILDFAMEYCLVQKITHFIIHCQAGISRSAACGAALSKIYNKSDDYFFNYYHPNRYIYQTILKTDQNMFNETMLCID